MQSDDPGARRPACDCRLRCRAGCTGSMRESACTGAPSVTGGVSLLIGGFVLKYLFFGVSLIAFAPSVHAQDDATITVTATGTRGEVTASGQAVTVISEDEIESVQGADLTRIFDRVPGVVTSRNGGVGSVTAVRLRLCPATDSLAAS